jgi:hypothetical protein
LNFGNIAHKSMIQLAISLVKGGIIIISHHRGGAETAQRKRFFEAPFVSSENASCDSFSGIHRENRLRLSHISHRGNGRVGFIRALAAGLWESTKRRQRSRFSCTTR